jgi:sulfotransferase family protein
VSVGRQVLELKRRAAEILELAHGTACVFVLGAPRTGTAEVAAALGTHPAFWTGGESQIFYSFIGPDGRGGSSLLAAYAGMRTMTYPEFAAHVGRGFDRLFLRRSGGRRWIDSADENTLVAEDLALLFPAARFVHVVRDGRAVVRSAMTCGWTLPWAPDAESAARLWVHFVREGTAFRERHPERVLELPIESLARAPEEECARLLGFLSAEPDPGPARAVRKDGLSWNYDARRDGMFDVAEDGAWEAWSEEDRRTFVAAAGATQRALGYACGPIT